MNRLQTYFTLNRKQIDLENNYYKLTFIGSNLFILFLIVSFYNQCIHKISIFTNQ
ncbi:hypothetical protein LEP1GSC173_4303 [Leptospira interrogans str. HAI1594]|nr:hypothetical protein LEP1GSC117_1440 [Leptospira interrogans serovar Icterohaemorrhagiae str. Verdun LP]EKP77325.1 hypothetical protein LEP1GSC173_4303 [Leptospira interrogans str. HAI1594]EMO16598.1 hypothetical protein LEP1GSC167_3287 [Leptospira interrogans serovar Copenhageni str. HAI0188]EMY53034.1 hypothetical protein LEP1GSC204_0850 [Leptospira interrogans serovar Copenhageni str. M20]